jgi:hypothetical protein
MSKFLVVEKPNVQFPMTRPDTPESMQSMALLRSQIEYFIKLRKDGKIIAGGPFLDIFGGCFILEVASVEEMGEIFFNEPLNPWTTREVHPLGSWEDTLEGFKEMASAMK